MSLPDPSAQYSDRNENLNSNSTFGRLRDRGWREPGLKTARNMARIGVKLSQNAFGTIPDVSCFDTEKLFQRNVWIKKFVFCQFEMVFGEPQRNGPKLASL